MVQEEFIERKPEVRSAGDILQNVVQDLGDIVRSEIQLAKTEMSEQASKAVQAGTMLGGAAVTGLLGAGALVAACIAALSIVMPIWAAALIMAFLLGVIAMGAFSAGRKRLKKVHPVPQQTARTLREDLQWARQHTR